MSTWGRSRLKSFRRTALRPVVACAVLAKDEVVGAEKGAKGARADRVHGAGLEIDEDGAGDIFVG